MDRKTVERVRLALFGRMIMGVSHEIDNHLSVIMGFSELLQLPGAGQAKGVEHASKVFAAGEKVGTIVKHFSYYVRPHEPAPEPFIPAEFVRDILPFSRYDLGRGGVSLAWPDSCPPGVLTADRRDLALALLALLFNGAEAMAAAGGGTLRLEVRRRGPAWEFEVADEGPGIAPEIMPRVFEEGFTTKPEPWHEGMGLPVARHLAAQMGGTVELLGRPGGGCLARLVVPGRPA